MGGWIKLYRSICEHWVWQDEKHLKWWLTIILNVNHDAKKFPVGTEVLICERGQSFRSIDQWTALFSCSKPTTIKFFKMLEKDNMIECKILGSGNRRKHLLSVVNWDEYQIEETENFTETVPETLPKQYSTFTPNKNNKNEKNEKKEEIKEKLSNESKKKNPEEMKKDRDAAIAATLSRRDLFYTSLTPFLEKYDKQMLREFFDYWSELTKSQTQMRFEKQPTWEVSKRLATWASKEKFDGNRKIQRTGTGNSAADKAASRQSLEEQANAILGINQPKNSTGGF